MSGTLYVCATPIGNLNDISKRLRDTLEMADLIAAEDTRHSGKLLSYLGIEKPCISYFTHNRRGHGEVILAALLEGKNVVLMSDAGTPAISDPGEELVADCAAQNIPVIAVPGPCAAIAGLVVSGLPTGRFVFEGFLSTQRKGRMERLAELQYEKRTMIFYEAPHKLVRTLTDFVDTFGTERKISLCREMTKLHEETLRMTMGEALQYFTENAPRGEFVLIVGGTEEKPAEWEEMTIEAHFSMLLEDGMSKMDAVKKVAAERGIPKRDVYDRVMK